MKRRPISSATFISDLIPLERLILEYARDRYDNSCPPFYGYELSRQLNMPKSPKSGGVYKALSRMETAGLLSSHIDIPQQTEGFGIPKRMYEITEKGVNFTQ